MRRITASIMVVAALALLASVAALPGTAGAIPLGPPTNTFDPPPTTGWSAINGPYSNYDGGDPFATKCAGRDLGPTTCDSQGANTLYNPSGEEFDVVVPAGVLGAPVTVSLIDPAFNRDGGAGDGYAGNAGQTGFATSFQLFDTTGDPSVISTAPSQGMDSLGLCTNGPGYEVFAPTHKVADDDRVLCTFTPTVAGIYPLVVKTSGIPGVTDAGGGTNDFSIEAATPVTGLFELNVTPRQFSSFRLLAPAGSHGLVQVAQTTGADSGHVLSIDLFDPGDSPSGSVSMQLQVPFQPGRSITLPPPVQSCSYSTPSVLQDGGTMIASPTCTISTRRVGAKLTAPYNGKWLSIETVIPYAVCSPVCTWDITYTTTKPLDDRLTTVADVGPVPSS